MGNPFVEASVYDIIYIFPCDGGILSNSGAQKSRLKMTEPHSTFGVSISSLILVATHGEFPIPDQHTRKSINKTYSKLFTLKKYIGLICFAT